ncbi:universal stress protein [Pararhizobium mangrovi]|uniref:Universal stress protein n=1 Tax=Pararhizobium mangrovi TaxID=2590452 RepID=A0A506U0H3_9HYPH|nr:universal stress protein [Pararhizobium mangrovi]TPW26474.1 universal stress protein [Pararhizobium mangrovi]
MKTLLVPVENHDRIRSILDSALLFARRFESRLTGFALAPATTPFLAADVIGASVVYEPLAEYEEHSDAQARETFEAFMRENAVERTGGDPKGLGWGWKKDVPPGDHMAGILARTFDLTVVGRSEPRVAGPRSTTLDAALFDSGRPILIAPPEAPSSIATRIVIAWNQSTETARTVAFAMPVLKAAEEVVVLTVEGSHVPGPSGEDLVAYLRAHGIVARKVAATPGKRGPGETILAEAEALGADLVVKGAFTQSRLRQIIFGGATQHILTETKLPIFMAH